MTKNDYYFAFSDHIEKVCSESDVRKKRTNFVHFFQDNWEDRNAKEVAPEDFAEEAIASLGLKKKAKR